MESEKLIPKLAFTLLREISNESDVSNENLQQLYCFFGPLLMSAAKLIENCKVIKYHTEDRSRQVFKITVSNLDSFTIYKDINYCQCPAFRNEVLNGTALTCKHVLAIKLIKKEKIRIETVSDSQFVDFLNEQINFD